MKRTSVVTLVLFASVGITVGVLMQVMLAQSGQPGVRPPLTLAIVLAAMGVIDILLAWPVRRVAKGTKRARVDPFYATRVVVLAKASSISGALLAGAAIGFVVYLLTRSMPPVGSIGFSTAMLAGACVLMVGGLIAEQMCKLPPDEGEEKHEETPAGV
jgi:hypothetical protein